MRTWSRIGIYLACALLIVFALGVGGCGDDGVPSSSETTAAPPTSATTGGGSTDTTGAGSTETTQATGEVKELVVGTVMPMSGALSVVGLSWNRGYDLYAEKVNEEGGVKIGDDTYTIKVLKEDGKGQADSAGAAARKLIQDGATVLFGEVMDGATAAVYDVAKQNGVLHVIASANTPGNPADIGADKDLLVRLSNSFDDAHTADLDFLKEKYPDVKTIAVSQPDVGFEGQIEDFTAAAKERGFEVIGAEKWAFGISDFVPTYTKLLSFQPDAIFIMVSAQSPYQLQAARQLGFTGPILANSPMGPEVHVRVAGPEACTDFFCNGINPSEPTELMADIMQRYEEAFKDEWISDCLLAWDELWILVQAMQKAGSTDPAAVLAALDSMTNVGDVKTSFGDARMGGMERFGVNRALVRPVPISLIMDGEIMLQGYFESANR